MFYFWCFAIILIFSWKSVLCFIGNNLYDLTSAIQRRDVRFFFWHIVGMTISLTIQIYVIYFILRGIKWVLGL